MPKRVVSMNVCTDQMAILVAGDGQLHSVSYLANDPATSALVDVARKLLVNHGQAEEVFLMQPDLVLAGSYTTRATVGLLRKLGIPVEEFQPETSFDDVRTNLKRMGDILGRRERAEALVAELDRKLAEAKQRSHPNITVATYYANSYTSGAGTLIDAVVVASGLTNLAAKLGLSGTQQLPLELLVMAKPDLLVDSEARYATPALAQQTFVHPAYRALSEQSGRVSVPAKYTICGAPFTATAVEMLTEAAGPSGSGQAEGAQP
ncbi:MAG TPA: ABC transporter substrate-binding protein [Mesorhizobium sp.]|uniref:ABC transporter substrate-binding protein n=1 Tax=Mesorhizobium sp. TaxID=1871066 RepID=UPI002DDCB888|nr:ABC transporter substrate-binding protein [Mesorhizobium sp.]HEV2502708.1 ABC transporter substrate-binding protein [Mesorhizobium sp.]